MDAVQTFAQQFNAADIVWIVGAVILAILAIKVAAKLLKFVLIIGVILLVAGFVVTSGIIPGL